MSETVDVILAPIGWLAWIISLPIRGTAWLVATIRASKYDPEKLICPGCGFRGDSGTGGKSCYVKFTRTMGNERAAIQHMCYRCGCEEIFTKLYVPAEKWLPQYKADQAAKIKEASAKEAL